MNQMKSCRVGSLFAAFFFFAFRCTNASAQSAQELLSKYAASLKVTSNSIIKSETYYEGTDPFASPVEVSRFFEVDEFRHDLSGRVDVFAQRWQNVPEGTTSAPADKPSRSRAIFDEHRRYQYWPNENISYGSINVGERDVERSKNEFLAMQYSGSPLNGHFPGDLAPLTTILSDPNNVRLRTEPEKVNDSACYVIDAVTQYGSYTVWIDPNRDYNIGQIKIIKSGADEFLDRAAFKPIGTPPIVLARSSLADGHPTTAPMVISPLSEFDFVMQNVQFKQMDGHWIPVEADFETTRRYADGLTVSVEKTHHRRTAVDLHPDFEKIHAFVLDAPDGTKVHTDDKPVMRLEWRGGNVVAVDRSGHN